DLATEALVQPIVVIRMQEAAQEEVPPQRRHLLLRQTDVPVTGEVEVRVVKEPWVGQPHVYWAVGYGNPGALPDGAEQVRQAGRVRVPVPAAVVLDLCYGERRALFRVRAGRGRGRGRWRPLVGVGPRRRQGHEGDANAEEHPTQCGTPPTPRVPLRTSSTA